MAEPRPRAGADRSLPVACADEVLTFWCEFWPTAALMAVVTFLAWAADWAKLLVPVRPRAKFSQEGNTL